MVKILTYRQKQNFFLVVLAHHDLVPSVFLIFNTIRVIYPAHNYSVLKYFVALDRLKNNNMKNHSKCCVFRGSLFVDADSLVVCRTSDRS